MYIINKKKLNQSWYNRSRPIIGNGSQHIIEMLGTVNFTLKIFF